MTTIGSENAMDIQSTTASEMILDNASENNTTSVDYFSTGINRNNIEQLGNRVRLTDKDEENGLELFCYVSCNANDSPDIKKCRGVVFHNEDIVMNAFPYTEEYTEKNTELLEHNLDPILSNCAVFDSHEGTLIRMFFFNGKWFTSTHRKLNAFRSKWSSKESFGTSFKRALEAEVENNQALRESLPVNDDGLLERFQITLDINKQYMFLVRNSEENRIVCMPPSRPTIYHVGTFINQELSLTENINIPWPRRHNFTNIRSIMSYIRSIDIRHLQGVIIFAPNNYQYKILHNDYQELFNARGNEPSIKFRYLQVRMNMKIVNTLRYLYPSMVDTFEKYENTIYSIAKGIYNAYVQRFIKKKWVTVSAEEFNVVRECHSWYEQNRTSNRITIQKVIEVLNDQTPTNINKMIRNLLHEKVQQTDIQDGMNQRTRSNTITSQQTKPSPLMLSLNQSLNHSLNYKNNKNRGNTLPTVQSGTDLNIEAMTLDN